MPLSKHYGGAGEEVAENMKQQYGSRWKEVFYATENARKKHMVSRAMDRAKRKRVKGGASK